MTTLIESLFPRYLFIHLDDVAENWAPIRSTRGVGGMVRWGDQVPAVPDPVIDCLRENIDEVGCVSTPQAGYKVGDKLLSRRGEDRVMVLLEVMKQPQRVVFPEASVARA
jgi:transcriptional antiterminator RfaH